MDRFVGIVATPWADAWPVAESPDVGGAKLVARGPPAASAAAARALGACPWPTNFMRRAQEARSVWSGASVGGGPGLVQSIFLDRTKWLSALTTCPKLTAVMKAFVPLVCLTLTVLPPALPAAQSRPNSLTPEEAASGWLLLFDGETLFGWAPRGDARWEASDGVIRAPAGGAGGMLATTTEFADYQLHVEFWIDAQANSGVFLRAPTTGAIASTNAYEVNIFDAHPKWPTGSISEVARSQQQTQTVRRWTTFDITARGSSLLVEVDGRRAVEARDGRHARGTIALQQLDGKGEVRFRNLKLRPLGLKSLFNGKDLSGWTVVPDHASVFSVTPEGWLNVKNGNGDLQSEGEYADFAFQLDILSNGTHLNSGVFFRALKGQFWSGYESQIRNQWEGGDRSKPVDYGTGGIYNRQPARRVISTDREWFTMTITAAGPHLATWVNGIQVTDFTDNRPANDNARQGYRAKAGVVSLQGHDPTTDLSFRNLQIAELPAARP
jgi:hypothetical protein